MASQLKASSKIVSLQPHSDAADHLLASVKTAREFLNSMISFGSIAFVYSSNWSPTGPAKVSGVPQERF